MFIVIIKFVCWVVYYKKIPKLQTVFENVISINWNRTEIVIIFTTVCKYKRCSRFTDILRE